MYLAGFGHHHQSEAIPNALPLNQNSPQHTPFGLYTEQLSGSAFTRARHKNLRTWVYRTEPSAMQHDYTNYNHSITSPFADEQSPNPMRWSPLAVQPTNNNFLEGLFHLAGNAQGNTYLYQCSESMNLNFFNNRDGEMLFIPYAGGLRLRTELGRLEIKPGHIAVIPRGITFAVDLIDKQAQGYVFENKGLPFTLPDLGILGANGLANPRHFLYPTAFLEEHDKTTTLCKFQDHLWISHNPYSPVNVVAWQGNYAPYCYDLSLFNTLNTVSFDHPDPSIFTVLTSESEIPGIANVD
ncbi:MAG: homogentisate 1,2-dioxygenase, partial [Legionellaceae bacterium]